MFVEGKPVHQGRPRAGKTRDGRPVMYDPANSKLWKLDVKYQAISERNKKKFELLEGPVSMRLIFYMPRPKYIPKKVKHHVKKPDLDNLEKAIKDALTGVLYKDDSQIFYKESQKVYCNPKQNPGVYIMIEEE
jgi:Holliday junction resolvase RusA-like endonuclease